MKWLFPLNPRWGGRIFGSVLWALKVRLALGMAVARSSQFPPSSGISYWRWMILDRRHPAPAIPWRRVILITNPDDSPWQDIVIPYCRWWNWAKKKKKCLHKWQDIQLGFSDSKPCSKPNWCKSHSLALVFPLKLFPQIFGFKDIEGQTGLPISDFCLGRNVKGEIWGG